MYPAVNLEVNLVGCFSIIFFLFFDGFLGFDSGEYWVMWEEIGKFGMSSQGVASPVKQQAGTFCITEAHVGNAIPTSLQTVPVKKLLIKLCGALTP